LFLCFCLWLLTACICPQEIAAARIAGEEGTVTTAQPQAEGSPSDAAHDPNAEKQEERSSDPAAQPAIPQPETPTTTAAPQPETVTAQPVESTTTATGSVTSSPELQHQAPASSSDVTAASTAEQPAGQTTATPLQAPAPPPVVSQPPATPASPPSAMRPHPVTPPMDQRYVTIDFDNVDIQVFIKFISELTGKNFIIDDKVKGKVTIISPKKIAVDEAYKVFESVLEVNGFATVQSGDMIKIVPSLQAREKGMETRLQDEPVSMEDKYVTQIIALDHASSDEMKRVLDPLISKSSVILSYPPAGMLIITDVLSNIRRLRGIIDALDVEGAGGQISYIPLTYASATEAIKSLNVVFQQQKGTIAPIRIVADDRANALIIAATENDSIRVRELVDLMDREIPKGAGMIRVYYLQNAKAEDTAKVLTSLQQQTKMPDGKPGPVSKAVQIVADKATNSLIITADPADYLIIEDVVKKLDISRAMVYLEALIMEVNANKSFGIGVEWSAVKDVGATGIGNEGSRNVGLAGFKGTSIIPQINPQTRSFSMPGGFALGVIGAGINITVGGQNLFFPNIGAVLQAFQSDSDIRILSTPQLLTLDNEDAEITVGSNVPYVVRQDTTVGTTTNYSNYEYKDVGVMLKVTPQINKDGFIRMKIDQSVTKIVSQSAALDASGNALVLAPTTLKRTAKTTVTVKNGETVVIGGMIQDDSEYGTSKVPFLGDIPFLGWLFKTTNTTSTKTNLFIFMTPRIIREPEDATLIQQDRSDYMRSLREGTITAVPQKKQK
jgi:general secretion pathway protein D